MNCNSECPICLDNLDFPFTLDCNHSFCYLCIKNQILYSNKNNTCPLCRTELTNNDIYKIFDFKKIKENYKIKSESYKTSDIIWGYSNKDNSAIWQYSFENSHDIEQAWQYYLKSDHKNLFILNIACVDYIIDFISMIQINLKTDKIRNISRIDKTKNNNLKIIGISGIPFN